MKAIVIGVCVGWALWMAVIGFWIAATGSTALAAYMFMSAFVTSVLALIIYRRSNAYQE